MSVKPVVLAVDDTPANLDLLNGILRDKYKVKVATNGSTALKLATQDPPPDIILLDIMMPDMSGYEVCRRLKLEASTAAIPIIFITSKTEVEDEQQGLDLGAVDYVTKPFHPDIILARVKTHLANHQRTMNLLKENQALLSSSKPVFIARDNEETFYVRMTNSTQALKTREVIAYIEQRFPDKTPADDKPTDHPTDSPGSDSDELISAIAEQPDADQLSISQWFLKLQQ